MDLLTKNGELQIGQDPELKDANGNPIPGDLAIGSKYEMEQEYLADLIVHSKGNFALNPTLGVGADELLNGPFREDQIEKRIRRTLRADNWQIHAVKVDKEASKIPVNATRNQE